MSNIERAPHEILRLNAEGGAKLVESEFVTQWLLTLHEYMRGGEVEIGIWLDANRISVFSEVTITDNAGKTLYNVPSIFMKQDQILPKSVTADIGDIMYRVENLNKTIPGKGDAFIKGSITDHVIPSRDRATFQERWDAIFVKYNLEPVFTTVTTSTINSEDEGFDDYDEL